MTRLVTHVALALVLAGCTLGPDYRRPAVTTPEAWRDGPPAAEVASLADLPWWELFEDVELRSLVRTAFETNKDLRITPLDLHQAEAELASTAAQIPDLERQIVQTENQLSILLGRNPGGIVRGRPLTGQTFPPTIPAGLPSALLERRPDIRQAEASLAAANARIGVAKAAFFPQVSLTGFFGVESIALSDLFTGPSRIWQFGPTVRLPIFTAGRNRANLEATEAQQQEALLRYEQAIQQAFREVEDALIAHGKARESVVEQGAAVRASREALSVAELRYTSGLTSYLSVLDAQRTLLAAEVAESRTLLAQLVAVVQLYRALRGGWDAGHGATSASR